MPLTSNVYHVGQGINTISQHDCCDHASSCLDTRQPYPVLCTLVERAEGISRDADELDKWYNSDSLFGFAIAAHLDRIVWMDCLERDVVLNHILSMGIYNWKDTVNCYYQRGAWRVSEGSRSKGCGTFRLCCEGEEWVGPR